MARMIFLSNVRFTVSLFHFHFPVDHVDWFCYLVYSACNTTVWALKSWIPQAICWCVAMYWNTGITSQSFCDVTRCQWLIIYWLTRDLYTKTYILSQNTQVYHTNKPYYDCSVMVNDIQQIMHMKTRWVSSKWPQTPIKPSKTSNTVTPCPENRELFPL